jgi:hypothetical protein
MLAVVQMGENIIGVCGCADVEGDLCDCEVLVLLLRDVGLAWQQRGRRLHDMAASVEEEVVRERIIETVAW